MSVALDAAARSTSPRREGLWTLSTTGLLIAYACVGLVLVGDYGITYDEHWHATQGRNVLAWYTSAFRDRAFLTYMNLRFYGVLFDLPVAVVHEVTSLDLYQLRHLATLCFAVLTVAGIARLAHRVNGPAAGFFAALALVLTPRFFGHGFNNGKDVAFAACTVWAVVALVRFAPGLPRPATAAVIAVGVWWGFALAIRMSALSFGLTVGVACAAWWLSCRPADRRAELVRSLVPLAQVLIVAGLVMLPFWPYIIVRPLRGTAAILREQVQAGYYYGSIPVLYDGVIESNRSVPWSYVWVWLVRVTPEFYLVGLVLAATAAAGARWGKAATIRWTAVAGAALLPMLLATVTRPAIYDGLRHFLFATVFLAVPVGAGVAWCVRGDGPRLIRRAGLVLFCVAASFSAADMVRLHPYQTAYFNRAVAGGLAGADGRWDTDYWGNSFREGTLWLVRHVPPGASRPRVASSAFPTQTEHFLPRDRFEYIGSIDETPALVRRPYDNPPDYYISFTRWGRDRAYPGAVIHRVTRDGVTLLVVVRVDRDEALRRRTAPPSRPG